MPDRQAPNAIVIRFALLVPLLAFHLCVSGCGGDAYSAAIRYGLRTDPLVKDPKLGEERFSPDPPGQLPLTSPQDVLDPRNPLYLNGDGMKLFKGDPPKLIDPTTLEEQYQEDLRDILYTIFGTPREPKVRLFPDSEHGPLNEQLETELKLGQQTLAEGSRLYRLHCLHCHGVTGDGRGPTAKWVNPHPRDYRLGIFKFQSVDQSAQFRKPTRQDLYRTLERGVEGTSMPAFNLLRPQELEALVSYVIHLSMRGQLENSTLLNAFATENGKLVQHPDYPDPINEYLLPYSQLIANDWLDSQKALIAPGPFDIDEEKMADSVRKGKAIFDADESALKKLFAEKEVATLKAASCLACHKDYGRQVDFKFDDWGTLVRPANLTTGVYRGGRRPVDFYYRIHSGINGSGMLRLGDKLTPEQIWHVVNFVRVLPYPAMRKTYGVDIP